MEKRIFGETDGIRVEVGKEPLVPGCVRKLAIAARSAGLEGRTILFGRDTRESGNWIVEELKSAFEPEQIVDLGVLPTPAIAKLMEAFPNSAAFMVTASHNPSSDNGIKLFMGGTKISDEMELAIEKVYFELEDQPALAGLEGEIEALNAKSKILNTNADCVEKYAQTVSEALGGVNFEGTGAKIVLDSACGAGFEFSKAVFEKFGLEVAQIDPIPDGKNINAANGALHPEVVAEAAKAQNTLGLALDGDADRVVLSDEEGRVWNGDRIVVLIAEYLKERGGLSGDGVVLTEYSNLATLQYLESRGIRVEKVVNGDKAVSNKSIEQGIILGGELAGHVLYQPWLDSSDGTFMALFVLKIMQEKQARLADLWAQYEEKPSYQVAVKVREKRPLEEIAAWNEKLAEINAQMAGDGRVFVRYSGTENKLRILVECKEMAQAKESGDALAAIVTEEIGA